MFVCSGSNLIQSVDARDAVQGFYIVLEKDLSRGQAYKPRQVVHVFRGVSGPLRNIRQEATHSQPPKAACKGVNVFSS
jgi:hypothetical protein